MRVLAVLATCVALVAPFPANALTINFSGNDYTGDSDITSPNPVATAVLTQENATTVSLKLSLASGIDGSAFLSNAFFNYGGNPADLSAAYDSGAPVTTAISLNSQNAGSERFDIQLAFDTSNAGDRLDEGEFSKIIFTGTGIDVNLFESLSVKANGNPSDLLAAIHIQGLLFPEPNDRTSGWYAGFIPNSGGDTTVPLPAALPLFATILAGGGLVAWRRKRKAAKAAA